MGRALRLAAEADYRTSPNPMVGAILLGVDGRLVGEGFHRAAGAPHAEISALTRAGDRARGGTAYVTLEPCAHHGQTPPCVDAIIRAGVRRVVMAMHDPDRQAAGGANRLRAAGVEVSEGVRGAEARRLNEFFTTHRLTGRPFVSAKFAASLDGRIATRTRDARWITGDRARAHGHRLRHRYDAILVGSGTVLADDPELSARFLGARQPLRVILDGRRRVPAEARVLRGPHVIDAGRDLPGLLDRLGSMGVISLLVEGGAGVHGSFFDEGLVDRVYVYISPRLIGGDRAISAVAGLGPAAIADAPPLENVAVRRLGPDLLISGDVHRHRRRPG